MRPSAHMDPVVGLCQFIPVMGDPDANARRILEELSSGPADVCIFPESFLTGYGVDPTGMETEVGRCLGMISDACRESDRAVAVGTPRYGDGEVFNSLAFLSPDGDVHYDKAHLARFGIYSEDGFSEGSGPAIGRYHGIGFGMCICYDVFFPEILHGCSLGGSSVNICVAASAVQSKRFLDTVLPARALENVTYTAYVNNTGTVGDLRMHGCSRALDPFGATIAECGADEGFATFTVDGEMLRECRETRRHLEDFRSDVDWVNKNY